MDNPRKILHIDPDFMITYFIIYPGKTIQSSLSIPSAIQLLKNEVFDLVLSEPHHMAILVPQN
ncbi:MAG: hypothetical protein HY787_08870 [Deltaproteobacteria bacterium]|jgi:hypothetical protein|nr:hypothetical protein [Deltaproteobacteria bacterium]